MGKYEWRLIVVLTVICVLSGGVLGWVNSLTAPAIAEQEKLAKQRALQEALPMATEFAAEPAILPELVSKDRTRVAEVYRAYSEDKPQGYVVIVEARGYAGPIRMAVGVTAEGNLAALAVISQSETPGLGAEIKNKSFLTQPAFRRAKVGTELAVKKDRGEVDAVSSATISSRAVVRGVNAALTAAQVLLERDQTSGGDHID
ncbi:MAG: RnfABCDGE type electron transport complex subunit G [Firmicutes bacterium]|nr:RnfABCDGE type electron transport complex subunit G [Bacillota bacterium]